MRLSICLHSFSLRLPFCRGPTFWGAVPKTGAVPVHFTSFAGLGRRPENGGAATLRGKGKKPRNGGAFPEALSFPRLPRTRRCNFPSSAPPSFPHGPELVSLSSFLSWLRPVLRSLAAALLPPAQDPRFQGGARLFSTTRTSAVWPPLSDRGRLTGTV